jgi:uncharacterized membrane protein YbjE (DUF340 family)
MKSSLIILGFFCGGLLTGYAGLLPEALGRGDYSLYALYLLMFLVGIGMGADSRSLRAMRQYGIKLFLVPLFTVTGTFAGVLAVLWLLPDIGPREGLAVGAGFGYYSLSSVIISELHSSSLGVIALLSNVMREIITLLAAPLLVAGFGRIAPVVAAGATSMDTTLPVITTTAGREFAVIALLHGMVLTVLVPLLVPLILALLP